MKDGGEAKFWLGPPVTPGRSAGFDARTLRRVSRIVSDHASQIEEAWNEHFRD
ncbi:DUF4160 domain-containing protein [Psychromarinibacter sp. C21-152]|uniref:DUF4160 domain-containing protein n=1 Tax=Psychromarinibacter sediminicola TaxID=3033385 RepID=A0AAE3NVM6_9RHOB|nr:DUF4160 domain-containing protein [Psychromarinibacter sediminicola]MDF0601800.1 DUF4160 domain-containing protein [Psychromarinibacter sediminicola]